MPELPEVETVRQGLVKILNMSDSGVERAAKSSKALRFPWPRGFCGKLSGQKILDIQRRAKYLIFKTDGQDFLCHLGMTGNWRLETRDFEKRKHDHFFLEMGALGVLVYNDARRFGFFDFVDSNQLESSRWFSHLGPEPLDRDGFSAEYLFEQSRKKQTLLKSFIMDQRVVVGVGNIYASEALFKAGLRPTLKAGKLTRKGAEKLVHSIREVLEAAIAQGGTTIRDFKAAGGSEGYFQQKLMVYGRDGENCLVCGAPVKKKTITGRSTFWCGKCQSG